ncbi:hypothetical protein RJ639_001781 [Escallonia herrerae]|uniref:Uncharacterized protein n=1 Tax=Escallonia herrerae TaxID=1293975 RepID=A0AA88XCN7_9ASTE|nr:hypothetical protein RJ639_001781 [Escallonia herrerae]
MASFFAGASTALISGLYFLHKDYKVAHDFISQQRLFVVIEIRLSARCFGVIVREMRGPSGYETIRESPIQMSSNCFLTVGSIKVGASPDGTPKHGIPSEKGLQESLGGRISALEKSREVEASEHVEAAE